MVTDSHEVLVCSYLSKKSTQSSTPLAKDKDHSGTRELASPLLSPVSPTEQEKSPDGSHHHHHSWWPIHGESSYWCVLRRGQFSYYKTKDEREAVNVIPRSEILSYRANEDELKLNIYTREKTMRFKVDKLETLRQWQNGLDIFLQTQTPTNIEPQSPGMIEGKYVPRKPNASLALDRQRTDYGQDDDGEEDDDYEILIMNHNSRDRSFSAASKQCQDAQKELEAKQDEEFYRAYDPRQAEHRILSGLLYAHVRTRFGRTKWRKFRACLTNRNFDIYSMKTNKRKKHIALDAVVDSLDIENAAPDTLFALITYNERLEFRAPDDRTMVEWIINFKSCVLVRDKIGNSPRLVHSSKFG